MTHISPNLEYHRVLAGEKRRIGRGLLAVALLLAGSQLFAIGLTTAAALIDAATGTAPRAGFTPLTHAAGIVSVVLLLPWSMLIQRWLYGVRGESLSSVVSRLRWDIIGKSVVIIAPAYVIILMFQYWVPLPQTDWAYHDTLWLLAIALLLVPLQAAGEEYGFRGLIFRVASSWSKSPATGLLLGITVSSILFALIHFSTSGWLNLWYLVFAAGTAIISWRTGGLEVAIVLHGLYNVLSFILDAALQVDPTVATDRSEGTVTAASLIPAIVIVAATIAVLLITRRSGPIRTPGR